MTEKKDVLTISWDELDRIINQLSQEIKQSYQPDNLLAVARGGLIPGVCLAHRLNMDKESFKSVSVKRSKSDKAQPKKIEPKLSDFDFSSLAENKVLLVDDVVASGESLVALSNKLNESCAQVKLAILVQIKREQWNLDEDLIDYLGLSCPQCVLFP